MIEKWKNFLDQRKSFGAFLNKCSKAFDSLALYILSAKLNNFGFDEWSLHII